VLADRGAFLKFVTVLGGYGVFGRRIAAALAGRPGTRLRIAGRTAAVGERIAAEIGAEFMTCDLSDIASLERAVDRSFLVVHAAGPFQGTDYRVAECCIRIGAHYIDIADGRHFVSGIGALDEVARAKGLLVISGASSVPAITHALISDLSPHFQQLDTIEIALSPGNQNPRGASTVGAILSYVGRPIRVWNERRWEERTGWATARRVNFPPPIGNRYVYHCDAPDLELFPTAFNAGTVLFRAGLELRLLNWLIAGLSRLRAAGMLSRVPRYAGFLANASKLLLPFGSGCGALGVWLRGTDQAGCVIELQIAIVTDSEGPAIPTAPAVILAKKLLDHGPPAVGASPCLGIFSLNELVDFLHSHRGWLVRGMAGIWDETPISPLGPFA
jgi:Saccharopine dehydrogenase NADP binding domain